MAMTWVQKGGARKAHLGMVVDYGKGPELRTTIGFCGLSVTYVSGGGDILDRAYALDRLKRGESVFYQRWHQMDEEEERKTRASRAAWEAMSDADWNHSIAMEAMREGERNRVGADQMRELIRAKNEAKARFRDAEAQYMAHVKEKAA